MVPWGMATFPIYFRSAFNRIVKDAWPVNQAYENEMLLCRCTMSELLDTSGHFRGVNNM